MSESVSPRDQDDFRSQTAMSRHERSFSDSPEARRRAAERVAAAAARAEAPRNVEAEEAQAMAAAVHQQLVDAEFERDLLSVETLDPPDAVARLQQLTDQVGLGDPRVHELAAAVADIYPAEASMWLDYHANKLRAQADAEAAAASPEAVTARAIQGFVEKHPDVMEDASLHSWFEAAVNTIATNQPDRVNAEGVRSVLEDAYVEASEVREAEIRGERESDFRNAFRKEAALAGGEHAFRAHLQSGEYGRLELKPESMAKGPSYEETFSRLPRSSEERKQAMADFRAGFATSIDQQRNGAFGGDTTGSEARWAGEREAAAERGRDPRYAPKGAPSPARPTPIDWAARDAENNRRRGSGRQHVKPYPWSK
jgi:hypothetical protein